MLRFDFAFLTRVISFPQALDLAAIARIGIEAVDLETFQT